VADRIDLQQPPRALRQDDANVDDSLTFSPRPVPRRSGGEGGVAPIRVERSTSGATKTTTKTTARSQRGSTAPSSRQGAAAKTARNRKIEVAQSSPTATDLFPSWHPEGFSQRTDGGERPTPGKSARLPKLEVLDGGRAPERPSKTTPADRRKVNRRRRSITDPSLQPRRVLGATVTAGVIFAALLGHTLFLQSTGDASNRLSRTVRQVLPASRGEFLDRNGLPLAINDSVADVFIDALTVTNGRLKWADQHKVALNDKLDKLAKALAITPEALEEQLKIQNHWVKLAAKIDPGTAEQIREIGLTAVTVVDLPRRVYPDGDVARGVVGRVTDFTHVEKSGRWPGLEGKSGLEALLNARLEGQSGLLTTERGPGGREIPTDRRQLVPPTRGASFELSLDRSLAYEIDKVLLRNVKAMGAIGGYIGVMDVHTGDLLASCFVKTAADGTLYVANYNAAVIDTFEPGSPMKIFTMAAALDRSVMTSSETINVPDTLTMTFKHDKDKTFHDDEQHPDKTWTMDDILTNSSNVGTIKIARKVGQQGIYDNLSAFGFGAHTGVADPKVESVGILRTPNKWSGVDIGTIAIGQGVSASPLQLLAGVNAIAADGEYVTPRLVRAEISPDGTRTDLPVTKRRVVSSETAGQVRSMMADVVNYGTGVRAAVKGFEVAGKTGTAQKPDRGRYLLDKNIASFSGFYPASAPELSIVVILDEPYAKYGAITAAPLFGEVVRSTAQRYQIAPRSKGVTTLTPVQRSGQSLLTPELQAAKDPHRTAMAPVKPDATPGVSTTLPVGADIVGSDPLQPPAPVNPGPVPSVPPGPVGLPPVTPTSVKAAASAKGPAKPSSAPTTVKAGTNDSTDSTGVDPTSDTPPEPSTPKSSKPKSDKPKSSKPKSSKPKSDEPRSNPPESSARSTKVPPSTAVPAAADSTAADTEPSQGGLNTAGKPVTEIGSQ
jgi:cell division protein FtsI (penicillin-binding protein 3)